VQRQAQAAGGAPEHSCLKGYSGSMPVETDWGRAGSTGCEPERVKQMKNGPMLTLAAVLAFGGAAVAHGQQNPQQQKNQQSDDVPKQNGAKSPDLQQERSAGTKDSGDSSSDTGTSDSKSSKAGKKKEHNPQGHGPQRHRPDAQS
jgi:hypothetical protein